MVSLLQRSKRVREERRQSRNSARISNAGTPNRRRVCTTKPKSASGEEEDREDAMSVDNRKGDGGRARNVNKSVESYGSDTDDVLISTNRRYSHTSTDTEASGPKNPREARGNENQTKRRKINSRVDEEILQEVHDWKQKYIELKQEMNYKMSASTCEIYVDGRNINKSTKMQLEIIVKNVMFPRQKFVTRDELQDLKSKFSIGNKLMDKMLIPKEERVHLWSNYAMVVKKHLDKIRSAKTTAMKTEFMKRGMNKHNSFETLSFFFEGIFSYFFYFSAKEKDDGAFNYKMEEYEELRRYPEAFSEILEDYVSVVVGKNDFKRKSKIMLLSSFVTVSDEAFALLTLKNNEKVWPVKFHNNSLKEGDMEIEEPKTRYTNRRRLGGSARDGWTQEGMKQFMKYYELVENNRDTEEGKECERLFLEACKKDDKRDTILLDGSDDESDCEASRKPAYKIPTDWEDDIGVDVDNVEKE